MTAISMSKHITPGLRDSMKRVGSILGEVLGDKGFALLVFDLRTTEGFMSYISNAEREDMLTAMREFIAVNEGRAHEPPEARQ